MRFPVVLVGGVAGLALLACASLGGGSSAATCKIKIVAVETWKVREGAVDAAYQVAGTAGSPGVVWLTAKVGEDRYLPGGGVDVGPGPYQAIVDLKLTGVPRSFVAILEVHDPSLPKPKRCKAKADIPN